MDLSKISPLWGLPLLYFVLLVFSWSVEYYFPVQTQPAAWEHEQSIVAEKDSILMSYSFLPGNNEETIVLLPDVLYSGDFILPFAESLQEDYNYNVVIPYYPENTISGEQLSHSLDDRTRWIQILADSLELDKMHVIGHGYGGLAAINWLTKKPGVSSAKSLTLLSSLGVQELNFLGNYTLNRSLYSLLYPVVAIYRYAVPHFGSFHQQSLNSSYVRTKTEMDQRDIRDNLSEIDLPVLVLHALYDRYIPLSTGDESHRLLPHSYFIAENGRHIDINEQPEIWSRHLSWFLDVVAAGEAPVRSVAPEERVQESKEPFNPDKLETISGLALVVIVLLLALSTLISEDISCIAGGLVVASGLLDFGYAVLGCFMGILIADVGTYFLGRWIGRPVLKWVPFRWFIKPKDMHRIEQMFDMKGAEIIFITRFLPGTRLPTYLAAGILKTDFKLFLAYFVIAITIWTPILVGISAVIGQPMLQYLEIYQDYALWIILAITLLIYSLIKVVLPLATVKGRREIYVQWVRFKEKHF